VRIAAKSREAVASSVEHLTLHYQVSRRALLWRNWLPSHAGAERTE